MNTIVIFRKDRDGDKACFALFPELPADYHGRYCTCFQHVGQHCAADYRGCVANSHPAKPVEYADLQTELEQRGYELDIRRRHIRKCTTEGGRKRRSDHFLSKERNMSLQRGCLLVERHPGQWFCAVASQEYDYDFSGHYTVYDPKPTAEAALEEMHRHESNRNRVRVIASIHLPRWPSRSMLPQVARK